MNIYGLRVVKRDFNGDKQYFYFNGETFENKKLETFKTYTLKEVNYFDLWQLEARIGGGWMTVDRELIK